MTSTLDAIAQLRRALLACENTGVLARLDEPGFIFKLTEAEYATFDAPEEAETDQVDGTTVRSKTLLDSNDFPAVYLAVCAPVK